MTPYKRIEDCWQNMPGGKRAQLEVSILAFAGLYFLREAIMGKRRWPRFALMLISIAYVLFALTFFDKYPEIVFVAGFVLGGVLVSIFVITLFTGGK